MLTNIKLEEIRKDMKLALSMVESTHNLQFEIGRFTYGSHTFKVSLEAAIGKNGKDADLSKTRWDKECYAFGLVQSDFGKEFMSFNGRVYTITDIRPRATKRPIVAENDEGTSFIFRAEQVKSGLSRMNSTIEVTQENKDD